MRLFFLRHGLADRSQWHGPDFERPLTAEGKERMQREAEFMARLNLEFDLIITSPLTRALQTAQIVAEHLFLSHVLKEDERLAGLDLDSLQEILNEYPHAESILLVGHEPDFSYTIGGLIGNAYIVCKKGSLARVDVHSSYDLGGELVWLLPPKVLAIRD